MLLHEVIEKLTEAIYENLHNITYTTNDHRKEIKKTIETILTKQKIIIPYPLPANEIITTINNKEYIMADNCYDEIDGETPPTIQDINTKEEKQNITQKEKQTIIQEIIIHDWKQPFPTEEFIEISREFVNTGKQMYMYDHDDGSDACIKLITEQSELTEEQVEEIINKMYEETNEGK